MATRLQRYEEKVKELEARGAELLRSGRYVQAINLRKDIDKIKAMIEEIRPYYEPKPLSEVVSKKELDEMGIIPLMIECHLIADFLTEVSYMVVDICKAHGWEKLSFTEDLDVVLKNADKFASFLTGVSPELCELLTRNETFNKSLHKKFLNHIDNRLKQFRKEKSI
ncbi:MAG: hypothetical protein J1E16_05560 [Muribaculaceae bacterium]|nr:hypothetical protein [Muribaculaceae bacterium]